MSSKHFNVIKTNIFLSTLYQKIVLISGIASALQKTIAQL